MGVGILAKRVVLELGLQHHLCLQSGAVAMRQPFSCRKEKYKCSLLTKEGESSKIAMAQNEVEGSDIEKE